MILISVPSFVIISFLIMSLGYSAKVLPTAWPSTRAPDEYQGSRLLSFRCFSLSCGSICGYCRFHQSRSYAKSWTPTTFYWPERRVLTKKQAVTRHALRNAMVPILPSILA
ncbi:MAG: hypothetical protein LKE52_03480 [Bacilli bacterium]|nr:hypothetical protein [Bacilli bacterium]